MNQFPISSQLDILLGADAISLDPNFLFQRVEDFRSDKKDFRSTLAGHPIVALSCVPAYGNSTPQDTCRTALRGTVLRACL